MLLIKFLSVCQYLASRNELAALVRFIDIVHERHRQIRLVIRVKRIGLKADLPNLPPPQELPPMDQTKLTADQYCDLEFNTTDAEGNDTGGFDTSTTPLKLASSDESVATVEWLDNKSARVFAHKKGAAVITVEGDGKQGEGEKLLVATHGIAVDVGEVAFIGVTSSGAKPKSDLPPAEQAATEGGDPAPTPVVDAEVPADPAPVDAPAGGPDGGATGGAAPAEEGQGG